MTERDVRFLKKDVTGSTNDDLKARAATEHTCTVVLFADKQAAGRGRQGRSFYSEGGLYMSILFPTMAEDKAPYLPHIAAVAVAEAIRRTGLDAKVKWVNDVYVGDKKVCGILAESIVVHGARAYVLGIGVNVGSPKGLLPEDIRGVAAFFEGDKNAIAADVLNTVFDLIEYSTPDCLRARYEALSFLTGRRVTVVRPNEKKPATVLGLSDGLGLSVRYDDGSIEELISGEVHLIL